jgi:hypothetical protein
MEETRDCVRGREKEGDALRNESPAEVVFPAILDEGFDTLFGSGEGDEGI